MMTTGSIGEWAAPIGAGAVWLEAQRLVAQAQWRNENARRLAGPARAGGRRPTRRWTREFGIKRPALDGPPRAVRQRRPADRLKAMNCGVQMAAFRWVTSAAERHATSARRSAPSSTTASRSASTATACTSRRSTRGCTSTTRRPASTRSACRSTPASSSPARRRCASSPAATPGTCAWRTRSARIEPGKLADLTVLNQRLLQGQGRGHQEDPFGDDHRRRRRGLRQRRARPPPRLRFGHERG